MMRFIKILGVLLFICLLLGSSSFNLFNAAPNLILIFLCLNLLTSTRKETIILSLVAGVILDFVSALPDGVISLSLLIAVFGSYYITSMFFAKSLSRVMVLVMIFLATIIYFISIEILHAVILFVRDQAILEFGQTQIRKLIKEIVLNVLFLYPAYLVHVWLNPQITNQNESI